VGERARFAVGRWLIHLGLWVMPRGRSRSELYEMLQVWGIGVSATVAAHRAVNAPEA
jgi:hypothetical protein